MERLKQITILAKVAPDLWAPFTTKLVRHTAAEYPALDAYISASDDNLEEWQRIQRNRIFNPCLYVIGLRGQGALNAQVVGVYQNFNYNPKPQSVESLADKKRITPTLAAVLPRANEGRYYYRLRKIWDASDLHRPLIIKWRNSPIGKSIFHQWAHKNPKEIIPC